MKKYNALVYNVILFIINNLISDVLADNGSNRKASIAGQFVNPITIG